MTQYCVYKNLNTTSNKVYPYLLNVQSNLLNDLTTRLVIPLAAKEKFSNSVIQNLNPEIIIKNKNYLVLTQQLAAIPNSQIGPQICECLKQRHEILSAIDFIITGI